jgi:hypothetical protein
MRVRPDDLRALDNLCSALRGELPRNYTYAELIGINERARSESKACSCLQTGQLPFP